MLYVILMIMSYSHEIFYMPSVCTVGPKSLDSSYIDWSAFHFYETRRLYRYLGRVRVSIYGFSFQNSHTQSRFFGRISKSLSSIVGIFHRSSVSSISVTGSTTSTTSFFLFIFVEIQDSAFTKYMSLTQNP